jgi:hypothetical protein
MENINKDVLTRISFECKHSIEQKKQAIEDANNKDLDRLKDVFKNEKRTPETIESEIDFFKSLFYENNINNINEYVSIINQNHFQRFDKEIIKQIRWAFEEKKNNTIYKKYCLICNPFPLSQNPYLLKYYNYYEFLLSQKKITEKAKNDTIKFDINTAEVKRLEEIVDKLIAKRYISDKDKKKMINIFKENKHNVSIEWKNGAISTINSFLKKLKIEFKFDINDKMLFNLFEKITNKSNIQNNKELSKGDKEKMDFIFKKAKQ